MKLKKHKKEVIDTLKFIVVIVIIIVVFKLVFVYVPPLNQYNAFIIQTGSMDPIITPDDIVIVKEINPEDIVVGDIMAFRVDITEDGEDDVVVHYIAEINTFNDELIFKSKPHISDSQDRWTLEEKDLIGVYQFQINNLGNILSFAQSRIGITFLLLDIIVISIGYHILFKKKTRKLNEEKEDSSYK